MNRNTYWMAIALFCGASIDPMHAAEVSRGSGTNHFMNEPSFRNEMMNYYVAEHLKNLDAEFRSGGNPYGDNSLAASALTAVFTQFMLAPNDVPANLDAAIARAKRSLTDSGFKGNSSGADPQRKRLLQRDIVQLLFIKMIQSRAAKDLFVSYYQKKYMKGAEYKRQVDEYKKTNNITGDGDPILEDLNRAVQQLLHVKST